MWDWVGCPIQSCVSDDTVDWGIQHGTGWDVPYSPMCLMVQWDGMDARDWGYSVGLGGMSHTVLEPFQCSGTPKIPLDNCWQS